MKFIFKKRFNFFDIVMFPIIGRLALDVSLWYALLCILTAFVSVAAEEKSSDEKEALDVLEKLAATHNGYHHGMGACVCKEHCKARNVLRKHNRRVY